MRTTARFSLTRPDPWGLHAENIRVDYKLREGKPAKEIVEVAQNLGVDLIVMATDGRDNIKDFVTGTITEYVINRASCPVLVIPYKRKIPSVESPPASN